MIGGSGCESSPTNPPYRPPPTSGWKVPDLKMDLDRGAMTPDEYEQQKANSLPQKK